MSGKRQSQISKVDVGRVSKQAIKSAIVVRGPQHDVLAGSHLNLVHAKQTSPLLNLRVRITPSSNMKVSP